MSLTFLIIASIAGFYMAWNIGANDSANSMAPAVGSRAITFKQAVIIAGVLEFIGAYFVGAHVTETIKKGVINPAGFASSEILALALLSAILGASLWVFFATWKELPVSTTHSIVGALMGVGLIAGGVSMVSWGRVGSIFLSWIISPVISGVIAFYMFKLINKLLIIPENSEERTRKYFPAFIFLTCCIICLSLLFKTPLGKKFDLGFMSGLYYSLGISLVFTVITARIMIYKLKSFYPEEVFRILQIFAACYIAFAHGANDVANAVGPISGIYAIYNNGELSAHTEVQSLILAFGGIGISIGIFTWGYRVMKTIGCKITELTNTRGFAISFSAATTVLFASKMGLPVSTTHAAVGAVVGIGLARGLEALDMGVVKNIAYAWILTIPAAALLGGLIFILLRLM